MAAAWYSSGDHMRVKTEPNIPTSWWHAIFVVLCLSFIIPAALPGLRQALEGVDILYYIYLLLQVALTVLAVREAWNYLTRQ